MRRASTLLLVFAVSAIGLWSAPSPVHASSPGGNGRIFYRGPTDDIWSMDPDGSDKMQLTFDDVKKYDPDVSPDGARAAYNTVDCGPWNGVLASRI